MLLKKFKLQKQDLIAVILPNCPEYPTILMACSMSGIIVTTLNPQYTAGKFS